MLLIEVTPAPLSSQNEEDSQEPGMAEAAGREEEILAICRLHGFSSRPTLENQLKALDAELHQLKEQALSGKADYIQTLFIWLSKRAGKVTPVGSVSSSSKSHSCRAVTGLSS